MRICKPGLGTFCRLTRSGRFSDRQLISVGVSLRRRAFNLINADIPFTVADDTSAAAWTDILDFRDEVDELPALGEGETSDVSLDLPRVH
jgi:hypothetical protein